MNYIVGISDATVQCIFPGWFVSLATRFNEKDLKPPSRYTLKKLPKIFVKTGYGLTDLVVDAREFKFQDAYNFELNLLFFWNYKNTQIGKPFVAISPYWRGIPYNNIYPGSISDSKFIEEYGAVYLIENEHEIMNDCGFSIEDFMLWGITLNRPKQKEKDQFAKKDFATNSHIGATWIACSVHGSSKILHIFPSFNLGKSICSP